CRTYDHRDGVTYNSENNPDDGINIPAICQHYTSETEGGHLGSVSAGKIRVAKAIWVLMAQLAGWNPGGQSTTPTPTSVINTPTPTPTSVATSPTPTRTPTPTSVINTPSPTPTRTLAPSAPSSAGGGDALWINDIDAMVMGDGSRWRVRYLVQVMSKSGSVNGATVSVNFNFNNGTSASGQCSFAT